MAEYKVGDRVTWTSSSNGSTKTKMGVIEAVLASGERPNEAQRKEADAYGFARDHRSYLVRVPGKTSKSKGKLYWPIASKLRKVSPLLGTKVPATKEQ